ncbi:MAG: hypothetical protein ABIH08_03010 [Candidatus Omnitrophota bacterium]
MNNQNRSSRTYVTSIKNKVIGYYTLAPGVVVKEEAPERAAQGLACRPIPVIILARLAVDKTKQSLGVGIGV